MIENDANWNFRRFKSPEVCQFLIKMRILGGTSGKKTPSKDRSGNVAAITGRRSSTYHLSIHAAITGRRSSTYSFTRRPLIAATFHPKAKRMKLMPCGGAAGEAHQDHQTSQPWALEQPSVSQTSNRSAPQPDKRSVPLCSICPIRLSPCSVKGSVPLFLKGLSLYF
jgi:hypothetical protein